MLVFENICYDLDEMKVFGIDIVCIGIIESDIKYNEGNICFIIEEVYQWDMQVFVVFFCMAGIIVGQFIELLFFGYYYLEIVVVRKDGILVVCKIYGIFSSFYYLEVKNYFIEIILKMLEQFDLDGIIWDEFKFIWWEWQDFFELVLKDNLKGDYVKYMEDFVDFFFDINVELKVQ